MKKLFIILGLATLASCKPNLKSETPNANGVDFSRYLAIGNSLTAGYADGSLYRSGQQNSYPAILSAHMQEFFGIYDFRQPLLTSEGGFPGPKLVLGYSIGCSGDTSLGPVPFLDGTDPSDLTNISAQGPFNNMGIPGIRAIDYLFPSYARFASLFGYPYAARMFTNIDAVPINEAFRLSPTFFTLWLGSNDILGYATGGGQGDPNLPISPLNISDYTAFTTSYDSVLKRLANTGAKGVIMNIPDVTAIPFFTTIPANGLVLDTATAALLNGFGLPERFHAGANNFVIQDVSLASGRRQIRNGELLLLSIPQDSLKCGMWGTAKPIPQQYVLTQIELDSIRSATDAFNAFIAEEALLYHYPLVDMHAYLNTVAKGIKFNGADFNTQFISGGAFSLDGVHLTPKGNALVVNEIIRAVNAFYKSTIPDVDVNKFGGIRFPK